jgi:hypothetical protein
MGANRSLRLGSLLAAYAFQGGFELMDAGRRQVFLQFHRERFAVDDYPLEQPAKHCPKNAGCHRFVDWSRLIFTKLGYLFRKNVSQSRKPVFLAAVQGGTQVFHRLWVTRDRQTYGV